MTVPPDEFPQHRRPDPWKGLAAGLVAGLAGNVAMIAAQAAWSRAAGLPARPGRDDVAQDVPEGAGGRTPSTTRAARAIGGGRADGLSDGSAGVAFHFAFGMGLGAIYGLIVEYVPAAGAGLGVPFGVAHAAVADGAVVPALGLSDPIGRSSARARRYSLAAHTVYAVTTELLRRGIRARL